MSFWEKTTTTKNKLIKQHKKVVHNSFHLYGYKLGYHQRKQKLEPLQDNKQLSSVHLNGHTKGFHL